MRHRMRGRKLGRMPNHRKILMQNLVTSLFEHERITTTMAKAKEMRPLVEKMIHKAKANTPQTTIILNKNIKNRSALDRLRGPIATRFASLPAGFTRITYQGRRGIDKSVTATIELIGNP